MVSFSDVAKGLLAEPTFVYNYDAGLLYLEEHVSRDLTNIRDGGQIVYTPYTGSNLAFYLNLLYRQSTTLFTRNFTEFIEMVIPTWRDKSSRDIIIQLEVWVITEMERIKLRKLEFQYESVIRLALQNLNN